MAIRHIHLEQPLIEAIIEYGVYTSVLGIPKQETRKSPSRLNTRQTPKYSGNPPNQTRLIIKLQAESNNLHFVCNSGPVLGDFLYPKLAKLPRSLRRQCIFEASPATIVYWVHTLLVQKRSLHNIGS